MDSDGGLDLDELVENWTVLAEERELVAGQRGRTRFGFVLASRTADWHPGWVAILKWLRAVDLSLKVAVSNCRCWLTARIRGAAVAGRRR